MKASNTVKSHTIKTSHGDVTLKLDTSKKSSTHQFNTAYGIVSVRIDVFRISALDAVEVYGQDRFYFGTGGFRVEGSVNGIPRGMHFYGYSQKSAAYFAGDARDAASAFLGDTHLRGSFTAAPGNSLAPLRAPA